MKLTKIFFLFGLLLLVTGSGSVVSAEPQAEARREPFKPLIGQAVIEEITPILTTMENPAPLQKFEVQQLQVTGIILGDLGTYAAILAPDGKTYMLTVGTPVGKYEGAVSAITENTIQIKEIRRFLARGEEIQKEETIILSLNPLQETSRPGSRFVVLDRRF